LYLGHIRCTYIFRYIPCRCRKKTERRTYALAIACWDYSPCISVQRTVFRKYVQLAHTQYVSDTTSNASSTRPVKRNVHVHHQTLFTGGCAQTYYFLRHSVIYQQLWIHIFRLPNTRLEQHRPRYLKMRASAAGRVASPGTVKNSCLLDSRQTSQIPWKALIAYKYSARPTYCAFTSSHFAARLERACLGRERALPKQARSRRACTCMSVYSDVRIRTPRHALIYLPQSRAGV
jgi:hypothetical protein